MGERDLAAAPQQPICGNGKTLETLLALGREVTVYPITPSSPGLIKVETSISDPEARGIVDRAITISARSTKYVPTPTAQLFAYQNC